MKTTIKILSTFLIVFLATACNDNFMERYPLSSLSPEGYFTSEEELKSYTYGLYDMIPEMYADFASILNGDDIAPNILPDEIKGTRIVPASGGGWNWGYLRRINFFLENSYRCENATVRAKYDGLARFWRALFYFEKVKRFGDVPWYDHVLSTDDEDLQRPRDSRVDIFTHMLEDINYAIDHLGTERNSTAITKWTALALKSRMCLFEGTFRKYHGMSGWETILQECVSASEILMSQSGYKVYTSQPNKAYLEMFLTDTPNPECILAKTYNASINMNHYLNLHIQGSSYSHPGMTRALFDTYLNQDGTRFTDLNNYKTMPYFQSLQDRDPRLTQSIRSAGYTYPGQTNVLLPDFTSSSTGYMIAKFVTNITTINGTNALPYYRYAEVLLNFAEAKAELGNITQTDIDKSVKLLRDRVNMPNLNVTNANMNPDQYLADQYPGVTGTSKGIILEIRRERRIELFLEGFRWPDILRWKEGQLLLQPYKGAYFQGTGDYDLDNDGAVDLVIYSGTKPAIVSGRQYLSLSDLNLEQGNNGGQIQVNPSVTRKWDEEKDYLYPIPIQELKLNKNLVQNPGWATE